MHLPRNIKASKKNYSPHPATALYLRSTATHQSFITINEFYRITKDNRRALIFN